MKLSGPDAWLLAVFSQGYIGDFKWNKYGLVVPTDVAYGAYEGFIEGRRAEYQRMYRGAWAKRIYEMLGSDNVQHGKYRFGAGQVPGIKFGPLCACRTAFEKKLDAEPGMISWDGQT